KVFCMLFCACWKPCCAGCWLPPLSLNRETGEEALFAVTSYTVRRCPSFSYSRCFSWPVMVIRSPFLNSAAMFSPSPSQAETDRKVVSPSSHWPVCWFLRRELLATRKLATAVPLPV